MIAIDCRLAGDRSAGLEKLMRICFCRRDRKTDIDLLEYLKSVWREAAAYQLLAGELSLALACHAGWEQKAELSLISGARVMAGDWRVGAYSIRQGGLLYVICGSAEATLSSFRHEIAHYYLRRLLAPRLADSEWEERLVQYETGWHLGQDQLAAHRETLARLSAALGRLPASRPELAVLCEGLK